MEYHIIEVSSRVYLFQLMFLLCFSRFGNLIEVYLVSGKNVGYAKYADRISANDAIATLHGKILNGVRLKVMLAESPREESNKRQRTY
jgi:RNA recognition motif-containing protein